jgi:hypothetical protein
MPRQDYFTRADLKSRGWNRTLIKEVLGRWDWSDMGTTLWWRSRVEKAEAEVPEVKEAIERAGPQFEEHQRLVDMRDRSFSGVIYRQGGFAIGLFHDGTGVVQVILQGPRQRRRYATVNEPEFEGLARGACELKDGTAVLDWLVEHGAGDDDFRWALDRCIRGGAKVIFEHSDSNLSVKVTDDNEVTVHLNRSTPLSVVGRDCVEAARQCGQSPLPLLTWLEEQGLGTTRFRTVLERCIGGLRPGEQAPPFPGGAMNDQPA